MRALISVSNKEGVVEFAKNLQKMGWEIISTGGTLKTLKDNGVDVKPVSKVTNFEECLDGRVKTLHPNIHGGILSLRDNKDHVEQLSQLGIENIDLVAVNLYPFRETILKDGATMEDIIENIDIGGPTMIRSAAKNHKFVITICDHNDYDRVIKELEKGDIPYETRYELALKAFQHTALYDSTISNYFRDMLVAKLENEEEKDLAKIEEIKYPKELTLGYNKVDSLRYGENPHQDSSLYQDVIPKKVDLTTATQLNGKEMSFNNINDATSAIECLLEFDEPSVVAVKHANPCGVASGKDIFEAYKKAYDCDPISIFGGIVACNRLVDEKVAKEMNKIFLEIIIAPEYTKEALEILREKKNLRVLEMKSLIGDVNRENELDIKKITGGILLQSKDGDLLDCEKTVTKRELTDVEKKDLIFALKVVKHVRSNGIVLAKDNMTIGIGVGQTNRIWALENAIKQSNFSIDGAVMASDAFFPFNDCVAVAGKAGIKAIVQPGGSIKDEDSINKADEQDMSMIFTGQRHFKH